MQENICLGELCLIVFKLNKSYQKLSFLGHLNNETPYKILKEPPSHPIETRAKDSLTFIPMSFASLYLR